jgi:hypothetical protein
VAVKRDSFGSDSQIAEASKTRFRRTCGWPETRTRLGNIEHEQQGHTVLLFVRQDKKQNGLACPYHFLGPASYVSHAGSRPVSITWRLRHPMPARLLRQTARSLTG